MRSDPFITFWVFLEVFVFYAHFMTSMLFLIYQQIKGDLGYTNRDFLSARYHFDALEYY